jgi:hypothetical protein
MAFSALLALSSAALLVAAVGAFALGLFWAAAALERWLDATASSDAAVVAVGEAGPVVTPGDGAAGGQLPVQPSAGD